ncbi:hypothetical protein M408DRAFT_329871 [Serendipita vermifera MAFF 305830]|uniref:Uncharacterized protein n=1 Tax=Serendipita vermifera MAFF 305830 TaxID=933852 RepID=A0A0C2W6I3_SERVB|nr:hypothetical protein M408DRAFT_333096 [Serendipita vermifera MAFF 305830]KIM27679.1 hypothetical protein M408DRAFT_329871 [Serendipita vermifera MAFF 305830]
MQLSALLIVLFCAVFTLAAPLPMPHDHVLPRARVLHDRANNLERNVLLPNRKLGRVE